MAFLTKTQTKNDRIQRRIREIPTDGQNASRQSVVRLTKNRTHLSTPPAVFEPKFTPNVQISQMSLIPGAVIFINYEALLDLVEQMPFCFRGTVCVHEEITGAVLRPVLRIVTRPRNSSTQGSSNGRSGFYAFLKVDCEWFESKFGSIQKTDHLIRMSGLITRLDAHRSNYAHPNGALMKSIF